MISIKERKEGCYGGEPDIFPGNWIRRSPIDEDNQEFDITRRDLEEPQGVPYISIPSYDVEF